MAQLESLDVRVTVTSTLFRIIDGGLRRCNGTYGSELVSRLSEPVRRAWRWRSPDPITYNDFEHR